MYLHLGQETVVKKRDIIGIFDLDTTTVSKISRNYINGVEKKGQVVNVSFELPKSFIVCSEKNSKNKTVYISQISSQTLLKRHEGIIEGGIEIKK
ncbi:MAG: DUF370 domain-containing protein [Clostridia bacterium]|nr:DUF370 domain-containing protein [Clostridia bacterium]